MTALRPVLVVDDDPLNRDVLARRLEKRGFEVTQVADGLAALRSVEAQLPSLILLDVHMPGMDGVQVVRQLRARFTGQDLPIIMVSADAESEGISEALDAGADDYVTKPIEMGVLLARMRARLRVALPTPATAADRHVPTISSRPAWSPLLQGSQGEPLGAVDRAPSDTGDDTVIYTMRRADAAARSQQSSPQPSVGAASLPSEVVPPSHELGRVIAGRYRIEALIGSGGFGTVFRCRHTTLETDLAIKILHRSLGTTSSALARFRREGVANGRVRHPNAVTVHDFGIEPDGLAWLAMELLHGETLADRVARTGPLSASEMARLLVPICEVLHVAHSSGVIHRDLKPANIFLHQSQGLECVKVMDFGVALLIDTPGAVDLTMEGALIGTPAFIAPEVASEQPATSASDVYSLAVLTYCTLTGRHPYLARGEKATSIKLLLAHTQLEPSPLSDAQVQVSEPVAAVVLAGLSRDPADRPTPLEFARRFEAAVAAGPG